MSDAPSSQTRPANRPASTAARPPGGKARPEAAPTESVEAGGLGTVVIRNEFYRDGYRTLLKIALIEGVIIIGLILAMFYVVSTNKPQDRYFATTNDGRLVPMVSLNEPNLSTPALMSWTAQAATEVMTFGFHDYRRRLQEASRNFTRIGWASFTTALEKSRIMESVEQNQQVLTAAPTSAPVLISEGVVNGRYQWQVELPMVITYQAGALRRADNLVLTLLIVRVSKLESPNGVGIEQWIAQPR